eukprot:6022467-Amphidinium_carterae.1
MAKLSEASAVFGICGKELSSADFTSTLEQSWPKPCDCKITTQSPASLQQSAQKRCNKCQQIRAEGPQSRPFSALRPFGPALRPSGPSALSALQNALFYSVFWQ